MSQNVVKLLGTVVNHNSLIIITEYCDKCDMSRWMDVEISTTASEEVRLTTVLEAYVQIGEVKTERFQRSRRLGASFMKFIQNCHSFFT